MDSNTHSTKPPTEQSTGPLVSHGTGPAAGPPEGLTGPPEGLARLAAVVNGLAAEDPDGLTDAALAEEVLELRRMVDRLDGVWLRRLAALDARGAAGADQGVQAASTASWLRNRLRMGANAATSSVHTARALFRGTLTGTAQVLTAGEISPAHARVVAVGTHHLPHQIAVDAEPTLVAAARRLDPPRLRRVLTHLHEAIDPDGADGHAERLHARRWLRVEPTFEGMVAIDGLLDAEAGQTVMTALEPLARPAKADDTRTGGQRQADALTELARRALEGGQLPQTGGVRPQLTVMVELDSLQDRPGALGGEVGWAGPLAPEACQRLACDGVVTRVMVTRHQTNHHHHDHDTGGPEGLAALLQTAMTRLPAALGGVPSQPLEVGRTSRVVTPAQRSALAVRDGGCSFPDCDRPLAWCEAHHVWHWADGGPTDLENLVLLCRAHHRAVHEGGGGWNATRRGAGPPRLPTEDPGPQPDPPTGGQPGAGAHHPVTRTTGVIHADTVPGERMGPRT
jgi:Domain of unknown function (DUF222)/HNH endonuclease